jgi:Transposase DDE domain.
MLHQNEEKIKQEKEGQQRFMGAMKTLGIAGLLWQSNIRKESRKQDGEKDGSKRSVYELFKMLLLLVFQGGNLFRFLSSDKGETACSKNSYYRFLEDCHANWNRFVMLLAARVITRFSRLTRPERVKMFVLDDSVIPRERSKKTELLSHVYDHVRGKTVEGFNLLALGWTDAFSFVPVAFRMLASANREKRLNEADETLDKRTNGSQRRKEAVMHKPDAAISLIREALNAGITAQYVLMDTWFTNEPFIKRVTEEGLHVIGMLKDNKQKYRYNGKSMGLKELAKHIRFDGSGSIFGSVQVKTEKNQIPVKLVFVRNRNKPNEYIIILSTDTELSDSEIVRLYGDRWSIECCFKVCKSLLKLGKEFHGISYDLTVSSTALVFTRYILLEWIRRQENDGRTLGELVYCVFDEVRDMELADSLQMLFDILLTGIRQGTVRIEEAVRAQLMNWFCSQPRFIQCLFRQFFSSLDSAKSVPA